MASIGASQISDFEQILELAKQFDTMDEFIAAYPDLALHTESSTLENLIEYFGWAEAYQQAGISDFEQVVSAQEYDLVVGFTSAVSELPQQAADYVDDAQTAYETYVQSGGAPPTGGPPPVYTWGSGAISVGLYYKLCQVLSVAMPVAMVSMSAIMGYSFGTKIYEENPEFAEEFFRTLLPFTFNEDKDKLIAIYSDGKTYIDRRVFDAAKHYLEESLIPGFVIIDAYENPVLKLYMDDNHIVEMKYNQGTNESESVTIDGQTYDGSRVTINYTIDGGFATNPIRNIITTYTATGVYPYVFERDGNKYQSVLCATPAKNGVGHGYISQTGTGYDSIQDWESGTSPHPLPPVNDSFPLINTYTRDGKTVAWRLFSGVSNKLLTDGTGPTLTQDLNNALCAEIAWNMVYGNTATTTGQKGVSEWEGDPVSDPYSGAVDVVTDTDGSTVQYIPISLVPDNEDTLDPMVNPNPQQYANPSTQVAPYGNTEDLPFKKISPAIDTSSNPDTNPSQSTETQPATQVPTTTSPSDTGTSPTVPTNTTPAPFDPSASTPSGLINVYNPTAQELYDFGAWLWVTYSNLTIQKIFNNPFDGVISLHEIYFSPVTGSSQQIRSGFLDSGVYSNTVPQRYSELNCGSIVIPEYFGNYLDYSPYTKVYLYLPFIGIEELDAEDVIGAAVNVTYGLDSYSGACVAMVTTAKDGYNAVTYQFTGNASVSHPMSGGSQAQNLIAMCTTLGSTVIGAVTGGLAGAVTSGLGSFAGDMTSVKSSVYHSGTFTGNFGAMACKTPYFIVKRPKQVVVPNYNEFYGFPAHKYVKLGSCTGYVRCREVHVNSARATDEEKQKIEELLKSGVYLT